MPFTATVIRGGSGILSVAAGGTGVATSTGSGNVVLSTAPTVSNVTLAGNVIASGLTANRVVYTDASKQLTSSTVTDTELGYLSGVTSAIQSQFNNPVSGTIATGTVSSINATPKALFTPVSLSTGRYYVRLNTYFTNFLNASTVTAYAGFLTVSLSGGGGTATVSPTAHLGILQNQVAVASVSGQANNPVHFTHHSSATDFTFTGSVAISSSATYTRTVWGVLDFYMDVTVAGTWAPATSTSTFTGGACTTSAVFQKVS